MVACNKKCCCGSFGFILGLLGIGILVLAFFVTTLLDDAITSGVKKGLQIQQSVLTNAEDKEDFMETNIKYTYWGWNVTNVAQALAGTQKLNFQLTGPYNFTEFSHKFNVTFSDTDEGEIVSYNQWWQRNPDTPDDNKMYTDNYVTFNPGYLAGVFGINQGTRIGAQPFTISSPSEDELINVAGNAVIDTLRKNFANDTGAVITGLIPNLAPFFFGAVGAVDPTFWSTTVGVDSTTETFLTDNNPHSWTFPGDATNPAGLKFWANSSNAATLVGEVGLAQYQIAGSFLLNNLSSFQVPSNTLYRTSVLAALSNFIPAISTANTWAQVGAYQYGTSEISQFLLGTNYLDATQAVELANFGIALSTVNGSFAFLTEFSNAALWAGFMHFGSTAALSATLQAELTTANYAVPQVKAGFRQVILGIFLQTLNAGTNYGTLFTKRPLADIIFGYPANRPDPFLTASLGTPTGFPGFSSFHKDENDGYAQIPGPYQFFTGKNDVNLAQKYYSWRGIANYTSVLETRQANDAQKTLYCLALPDTANATVAGCPAWKSRETIRFASRGTTFIPFLEDDEEAMIKLPQIGVFSSELQRTVNFSLVSNDSEVLGVRTRRYELADHMLEDSTVNPNNDKYYMTERGFAPLGRFARNLPVQASRPYFIGANTVHRNKIVYSPAFAAEDEPNWATYFHVEPLAGAGLKVSKKLQFNLLLSSSSITASTHASLWTNGVQNTTSMYVPLFIADEHAIANQSDANKFKTVYDARKAVDKIQIAMWVVGPCFIVIGGGLFLYYIFINKAADYGTQASNVGNTN